MPTNTQLVKIDYTAKTPENAQRYAEAYAVAYLAQRSELALSTQKASLDNLNKQASSLQALLTKAATAASAAHPPADAQTKVQVYSTELASLQAEIGRAQSLPTQPGEVVVPAQLPVRSGSLTRVAITVGGALLGLIVGLVIATWARRRDDRIHAGAEPTIVDLPVLATVQTAARRRTRLAHLDAEREDGSAEPAIGVLAASRAGSVIAVAGCRQTKAVPTSRCAWLAVSPQPATG